MQPHLLTHELAKTRERDLRRATARRSKILATAFAALALTPAATASAGTIHYEAGTLVLTAAPGERNGVTLGGEQAGRLSIADANPHAFPADRCSQVDADYAIQCELPDAIRVDLGDGDDTLVVDHMVQGNPSVAVLGGAGADNLKAIGANTRLTLDGGPGADILRSEGGSDVLRGGPDGDDLAGGAGSDVLEGGDGDDTLGGDACGAPAADVLDGGAGYDVLTDWGDCGPGSDRRPVTVTVNGRADDGRPGEGDDVRDLDVLELYVPATVVGTDAAESVAIHAAADREPSSIDGRGGADDLRAGAGRETIAGGAGDDRIEGGWNHDTLTGGPGRDVIYGDATSGNCGGNGQSCTIPFGNDTIDARDGEADTVDCGPGADTVRADGADTIAANCESVDRAAGDPAPAAGGGGTQAATASLRVDAPRRLRALLRDGVVVRLAGFPQGATRVSLRAGRRVLATRRVSVGRSGRATVRLRVSRSARRGLARRRSVRLSVSAGGQTKTLTVTR